MNKIDFKTLGKVLQSRYGEKYPNISIHYGEVGVQFR